LELGGPLRPSASGGNTGVFINGREIHPTELAYLQRVFGYVIPGRYWLDAQGIGGFEGGPAAFNLFAAAAAAGAAGGYGGYARRTPFGGIGGDAPNTIWWYRGRWELLVLPPPQWVECHDLLMDVRVSGDDVVWDANGSEP
jgi:hypothetical protein